MRILCVEEVMGSDVVWISIDWGGSVRLASFNYGKRILHFFLAVSRHRVAKLLLLASQCRARVRIQEPCKGFSRYVMLKSVLKFVDTCNLVWMGLERKPVWRIVGRLWARRSGVRISAEAGDLSILQNVQTGSVVHPASYSVDTPGFFLWVKATGTWGRPLTSI